MKENNTVKMGCSENSHPVINTQTINNPFFIVGCGRSGTTLLKSILSYHSDLYVMPETFFFRAIAPTIGRQGAHPWKALNRWWMRDAGVESSKIEPFVKSRLQEGESKEYALFRSLFDFYRTLYPGKVLGEKTPDHINYLPEIVNCYPNARIIQMVRDPRGVLASYRKVNVGSNSVSFVSSEWRKAEEIANARNGADNFLLIRYEDLIFSPEATLRRILKFIGVRWCSEILQFHKRDEPGYAVEQGHHSNTRKPLFNSSIDSWKQDLTSYDISLIEWSLGKGMLRHGYSLTNNSVRFPKLGMKLSWLEGTFQRFFIQFPRQRLKAMKARKRLSACQVKK